ncbi:MAG: diguanylate cyclase [Candidatus Omnitrophica bacterium]|nr:diguanylate cyclase [Candidatus Omnitrophota bacterium]
MAERKNHFLVSQGLKYKLRVSAALMSVLPLLVCGYLVSNYILPSAGFKTDIILSLIISVFIAVVGFFLVKEVFDRILSVTTDAKLIAAGDISRRIEPSQEDEVGDLGHALNQLTQRIRTNMDELKNYGEKTTEINLAIQKRVLVLSSLLQISSLISQSSKLEDIFRVAAEKARLMANSESSYLFFREEGAETFLVKAADGVNSAELFKMKVEPHEIFERMIKTNKPFIVDAENILPEKLNLSFQEKFKLKNTLALPVYLRGRIVGIIGIGNARGHFIYNKEDMELLDIFAKQISIAVENDVLMHRVEKLEIRDALTGLYNEAFIRNRLQEEIKRAIAYQRPCGLIIFDIDDFGEFHQNFGSLQAEAALKKIASLFKGSIGEVDRVGRFGDNEFAVVLPEKNKRQVHEIAEDVRKKIVFAFSEEQDTRKRLTISAGVAENPLDGIDSEELVSKAKDLVKAAKAQGKNRTLSSL